MTTNNEVKAPRPCTLWEQTLDSNLFRRISVMQVPDITSAQVWLDVSTNGELNYIKSPTSTDAVLTQKYYNEAIQAIASAQRSWLKAEGFEFVQDEVYMLLNKDGGFAIGTPYLDTDDPIFLVCDSKRNTFDNYIDFQEIVAFKPISDSQQAWDAVAGVEVWEVK